MNNTRAIDALRQIMRDRDGTAPRRRVEAAEHLLDYECPKEVVVECKEFLTSIFEDGEQSVDIRLDALKLLRKAEARKVVPPKVAIRDIEPNLVQRCRMIETLERKSALIAAGVFPLPEGWDDDLNSPDYMPMLKTMRKVSEPDSRDIGEVMRDAREARMRKVKAADAE